MQKNNQIELHIRFASTTDDTKFDTDKEKLERNDTNFEKLLQMNEQLKCMYYCYIN